MRTASGAFGSCLGHFLDCYGTPAPRFNDASQCRGRNLRQKNHAAIGVHKELNPVPGLQPKMFADSPRDGSLALDGDG